MKLLSHLFPSWLLAGAVLLAVGTVSAADQSKPAQPAVMSFDLLSVDGARLPWTSAGPRPGAQPSGEVMGGGVVNDQKYSAAVLGEGDREAYFVEHNGTLTWWPQGLAGPSQPVAQSKDLEPLSWISGMAWDTNGGVLALLSSSHPGHFYRYDTRRHRWLDARKLKYGGAMGLAYNAQKGSYAAITLGAELLLLNARGEIEEVRPLQGVLPDLVGARQPGAGSLEGLKLVAQGERLAIINVRAGAVSHIWVYELDSRKAQLTYPNSPSVPAVSAEAPASVPVTLWQTAAPPSVTEEPAVEWLQMVGLLQRPAEFVSVLSSAAEARLYLAALVTLAALLALVAWNSLRPTPTWRRRVIHALAGIPLAALPLLMALSASQRGLDGLLSPEQWWRSVQMLFAAWRLPLPLESVFGQEARYILSATALLALTLLALGALLFSPRRPVVRLLSFVFVALLAIAPARNFAARWTSTQSVAKETGTGEALFKAKCKLAGAKLFYPVGGVEGVRLTGLRQAARDAAHADRDWPEAGIPGDFTGMDYIKTFLDFQFHDSRGTGETVTMQGYRFVDVLQPDGSYLRYSMAGERPRDGMNVEPIAAEQAARYAVDYARSDTPQERDRWVAGATVSVTDTQTGKVIGELKTAAYAPPARNAAPELERRSWHGAKVCPGYDDVPRAMTRMFTERVLQQTPR